MVRSIKNKQRFTEITPLEYLRKLLKDTVPESDERLVCKWSDYRDLCAHMLSQKAPEIEGKVAGGCSISQAQIA